METETCYGPAEAIGRIWTWPGRKVCPRAIRKSPARRWNRRPVLVSGLIPALLGLALSCGAPPRNEVDYTPLVLGDWAVSTPEEEGLDPGLVLSTYQRAMNLSTIYSLLIVKNDRLVAEKYFNGQDHRAANSTASVTKSVVSSLVGIALRDHILPSPDQTIADYFPEIDWANTDPRKSEITIRQVLQMRSGFPWEEFEGYLETLFSRSNWIPLIEEFPLSVDPGSRFGYSNFTAHLMGIIVARAANATLRSFAQTRLFDPLEVTIGSWPTDALGYNFGSGDLALTPRTMAKYGSLYLHAGRWNGLQIIPAEWVAESLAPSSFNTYGGWIPQYPDGKILEHFDVLDYGYLWWSSRAGSHAFDFAWGHGGQLIVIVHDLDMIVVTTADYLPGQFGAEAWRKTKAIMELVGGFIEAVD